MKSTIYHPDRECPEPTHAQGTWPKCPGHTVEVPDWSDDQLKEAINLAFGRGVGRAFELIRKSPALWVLMGSGCWDEARGCLREAVKEVSPEAVKGFDSVK